MFPPVPTLVGVAAIFLAITIVYNKLALYIWRRNFKRENWCKPLLHHLPRKDPILGIDILLDQVRTRQEFRSLERVQSNTNKYGNTFGISVIGRNVITTIEPDNVKAVLSTKFKDFSLGNRLAMMGPLFGKGIFTTDGEFWAHSRALIRPNFVRDQVADLNTFEHHIPYLLKLIPRDGGTVDLQDLFFRLTIDSATEFLFGASTHTLKEDSAFTQGRDFAQAFNDAQEACLRRGRLNMFNWLIRDKKAERATQICHEFVGLFVKDAIRYRENFTGDKIDGERYIFLHELAKETTDKQRLQDELLNVLLAGRDTTASLLSNMWFMLARNPAIFNKLREEVVETFGSDLPTYDKLRGMKYLKYCMNESLRLHPVVPMNARQAINDTVLPRGGGFDGKSPLFVPKGYLVAYSTYAMHRRKDYYGSNADEFIPERWETLRAGWEFLPFNGGPRICPGQQYALTEAGYVTSRLCQEFKSVTSRDPGPWQEGLTLTLCSQNGTKVALTLA